MKFLIFSANASMVASCSLVAIQNEHWRTTPRLKDGDDKQRPRTLHEDDALQAGRLPILKSPPSRPAGRAHLYHVRQQKPTAKLPEKTRTLINSIWCKNTTSWISTSPLVTAMSISFRGNACSTRPRFLNDEHKTQAPLVPECRLIFQASSRPKHYSPG